MYYRGIIIAESLNDRSILDAVTILSKKVVDEGTPDEWNMYKVQIPEDEIDSFVEQVSSVLQQNKPWYTHFYHEDDRKNTLIAVFYQKVFLAGKSDNDLLLAIKYGEEIGIPKEQLDFKPRNVSDETW